MQLSFILKYREMLLNQCEADAGNIWFDGWDLVGRTALHKVS